MTQKKLSMAILGFGLFGEGSLLPGFQKSELAELVAIVKSDKEKAKEKAKQYDIPHNYSYEQKEKMLKNPNIQAVFVATPNFLHKKDTIDCLNAGKDVIVEEPMAMNREECKEMIRTAQDNKKKLMVAQCMRYCSSTQYIWDLIVSKKMGDLVSVEATFFSTGKNSSRSWKYDKDLAGGGAAFDLGVHMIDLVRYLVNSEIKNVNLIKRPENITSKIVDEFAHYQIKFATGATGTAISSFLGPRHNSIEIYGTKGYARVMDFNRVEGKQTLKLDLGNGIREVSFENKDFYQKEIDAFARAILENKKIPIPGSEGLINQKLIDMVNE